MATRSRQNGTPVVAAAVRAAAADAELPLSGAESSSINPMPKKATPKSAAKSKRPAALAGLANICVFCGSGNGRNPVYAAAANALGAAMANAGIGLVYGGGSLGLMGETARSVLKGGGHVTGIIPAFLSEKERMLRDVNELIVTKDMHERKRLMFERSDAFVALPGGIGTLEELVEQLTWSQLGRHSKPIVLVNVDHFWDPLIGLLDHMRQEAFIRPGLEVGFIVVDSVEAVVPAVIAAVRSATPKVPDPALPDKF
ncbi:MAG: TIGR00730 family Rossman fold protein [Hyphomicrobiaceae bacterium]